MSKLYWHCECGVNAPAQEDYALGDSEMCENCGSGVARVVTLSEATAWEQAKALGRDWRPGHSSEKDKTKSNNLDVATSRQERTETVYDLLTKLRVARTWARRWKALARYVTESLRQAEGLLEANSIDEPTSPPGRQGAMSDETWRRVWKDCGDYHAHGLATRGQTDDESFQWLGDREDLDLAVQRVNGWDDLVAKLRTAEERSDALREALECIAKMKLKAGHGISMGMVAEKALRCDDEMRVSSRREHPTDNARWITVIMHDGTPFVVSFETETDAREFFEPAQAQWSEAYLCEVVRIGSIELRGDRE